MPRRMKWTPLPKRSDLPESHYKILSILPATKHYIIYWESGRKRYVLEPRLQIVRYGESQGARFEQISESTYALHIPGKPLFSDLLHRMIAYDVIEDGLNSFNTRVFHTAVWSPHGEEEYVNIDEYLRDRGLEFPAE